MPPLSSPDNEIIAAGWLCLNDAQVPECVYYSVCTVRIF